MSPRSHPDEPRRTKPAGHPQRWFDPLRIVLECALVSLLFVGNVEAQLNWRPPTAGGFEIPPSPPPTMTMGTFASGSNSLGGSFPTSQPPLQQPEFLAQRMIEVPVRLPIDDEPETSDFLPTPLDPPVPSDSTFAGPKLSAYKNGFFQKLSFTETWLNRGRMSDYGVNEIETFLTVALPCPTVDWPILITPYMNMRLLDGPNRPDLPPRLYETYVDFMWVPRVNDRFIWILSAAPSEYTDFHVDGFRMTGKALFRYDVVPDRLQVIAGVVYLNRPDIRWLPAGGIIWAPNPDIRYEAIFPKPKFAHRIAYGEEWEDWLYVSGEFGGSAFNIRRTDGAEDTVILRDWRAIMGLERKLNGGAGFRLEIGYVFGRTLEYTSGTPAPTPGNTALIRLGIVF